MGHLAIEASYAALGCSEKADEIGAAKGGGNVEGKTGGSGIDPSTGVGAAGGDGEGGEMVIPIGGKVGGEKGGDEVGVARGRGVEEEGGQVGIGADRGGVGEEEGYLEGVMRVEEGAEDVRTEEGDWEGRITEDGEGGRGSGENAEEGRADKDGVRRGGEWGVRGGEESGG